MLVELVVPTQAAITSFYTLSLHDALPISAVAIWWKNRGAEDEALAAADRSADVRRGAMIVRVSASGEVRAHQQRSEEHTSELQSPCNLVCRLLLEKKNIKKHDTS